MLRKVIKISALDSPNVRLALAEIAVGKDPSYRVLVPGVLTYREYQRRLQLWDEVRKTIGLFGEFPQDASVLMYPPHWLNAAAAVAVTEKRPVGLVTLGVDSAQGGDNTAWAVCDTLGLLELISRKTPDTAVIVPQTVALMDAWNIQSENVLFDAGGGGKPHGDVMRSRGYNVRIIPFGSAPTDPNLYRRMRTRQERVEEQETKYVYRNRRAEMYGLLRNLLNPALLGPDESVFSLPDNLMLRTREDGGPGLRAQLAPVPLQYDGEGRMYLPPKTKPMNNSTVETLIDRIGCSPDEADALVLAVYGQMVRSTSFVVGRTGMKY